jgi:hypothetical protein
MTGGSLTKVLDRILTSNAVSYFYIPIGVLALTHVIQRRFQLRMTTFADLFAFILALDLCLIVDHAAVGRINPLFQPYYIPLFVVAWLVSAILLANSIYVQSLISAKTRTAKRYPAERVALCWFFGFVMMSFHLFAVLGG